MHLKWGLNIYDQYDYSDYREANKGVKKRKIIDNLNIV